VEALLISLAVAAIVAVAGVLSKAAYNRLTEQYALEAVVDQQNWPPWFVAFPGDEFEFQARREFEHEANANKHDADVYRMLRTRGAVDFYETKFDLRVRGKSRGRLVHVTSITADVVDRREPYMGRVAGARAEGADKFTLLEFDLDGAVNPVPAYEFNEDSGERTRVGIRPYFESGHVKLSHNEDHTFIIHARTQAHYCQWNLRIEYRVRRKTRMIHRADRGGVPFQTTGGGDYMERLKVADYWYWMEEGQFLRPDLEHGAYLPHGTEVD
jgi:hypothetical protein